MNEITTYSECGGEISIEASDFGHKVRLEDCCYSSGTLIMDSADLIRLHGNIGKYVSENGLASVESTTSKHRPKKLPVAKSFALFLADLKASMSK